MGKMERNPDQHTLGHLHCPACERAIALQAVELSPLMTFPEAFDIWIGQRVIENAGIWSNARYISDRSERDLRQYARAASKFFGLLPLGEIHAGHLREYQRARALCDASCGAWEKRAGANLIRKEIQTVIRVMRAAGAWTQRHEEAFEPLATVNNDVPHAMTPEEQHRWLHVASSREAWRVIYWWSLLALQTTAATNEMCALRFGDIFISQGILQVRNEGAKNKFRIRTVPLQTPEVIWALEGLMERARQMGASGPHHYLFPIHVTGDRYDPLRPMTAWGLRKPWDAMRSATNLDWLTPYDLRHTAITRMAEAGVPIQVIMSFAGHISPRMQQHYTTISMQAKRRWVAAAWAGSEMPYAPGAGWGPYTHQAEPRHADPQPEHPGWPLPYAVGCR
jgi:integrase